MTETMRIVVLTLGVILIVVALGAEVRWTEHTGCLGYAVAFIGFLVILYSVPGTAP